MSADCVFVDPHMHLWDFQEHPDTHDRSLLAGVRERALPLHYEREIEVRLIMA
jgi:predicted TIM-barrel fold metal-dependent hydrolase